jgi:carboxypeptidase C (cathepsin A)
MRQRRRARIAITVFQVCMAALVLQVASVTQAADAGQTTDTTEHAGIPQPLHVETAGSLRIDNQRLDYRAVAGQLLMKDADGKSVALFGYTAYTVKDADRTRPVLFAYNGGPGSASLWLHMGILGPQRTVLNDPDFNTEGPFQRVANEYSVLDVADLVMIDPVGTGLSRAVGDAKGEDFWGVDQDIRSVSDFIARWTTDNNRWLSPKFLLGESYGGMRSGGVAYDLLRRHNLALNGVILVSPFMNYITGFVAMPFDQSNINFITTYAATAWYHGVSEYRPDDLQTFLREAEAFASGPYAHALQAGARLDAGERDEVLRGLQRFTGIAAGYWDRANLRIDESRFTKELLRAQGMNVGRVDSRFTGPAINRIAEQVLYDPFFPAIAPAVVATFNDYYRSELGVQTDEPYIVSGGFFSRWDWAHDTPGVGPGVAAPNTGVDLDHVMHQNPRMRLLVQQGYFDLATPYGATQYFIDHLTLPPELRDNIEIQYYEAGHMMYVHPPSMAKFKRDLARFLRNQGD